MRQQIHEIDCRPGLVMHQYPDQIYRLQDLYHDPYYWWAEDLKKDPPERVLISVHPGIWYFCHVDPLPIPHGPYRSMWDVLKDDDF